MKIEAGKYYKTENDAKAFVGYWASEHKRWAGHINKNFDDYWTTYDWDIDGTCAVNPKNNLIAEWTDEPETLEEIKLYVVVSGNGDVEHITTIKELRENPDVITSRGRTIYELTGKRVDINKL